jgi:hypothetical protein
MPSSRIARGVQFCFVSDTLHNIADLRRTEKRMFLGSKTVVTPGECLLSMRINE